MKLNRLVTLLLASMFLIGGCASKNTEKIAPAKVAPEVQRQEMKKEAPKPTEEKKVVVDEKKDSIKTETEAKPAADVPNDDNMEKGKADVNEPAKTEATTRDLPSRAKTRRRAPAKRTAPASKSKAKVPCPSNDEDCEEGNQVLRKKPAQ